MWVGSACELFLDQACTPLILPSHAASWLPGASMVWSRSLPGVPMVWCGTAAVESAWGSLAAWGIIGGCCPATSCTSGQPMRHYIALWQNYLIMWVRVLASLNMNRRWWGMLGCVNSSPSFRLNFSVGEKIKAFLYRKTRNMPLRAQHYF